MERRVVICGMRRGIRAWRAMGGRLVLRKSTIQPKQANSRSPDQMSLRGGEARKDGKGGQWELQACFRSSEGTKFVGVMVILG